MQTVLIVIHLIIVVALAGVILIQRSEGGGLGIGGGSGFMTARGTANALTRTTAILATLFFITSLGLGILARYQGNPSDILDRIEQNAESDGQGILNQLGGSITTETPAAGDAGGSAVPTTGDSAAPASDGQQPAVSTPAADSNATGVPTGD
ncbi:preprotein translocase subunit SecG [Martelella sp. AD-3]|uniref:preprotein translocase subunit SecG n=1 Tax=Martelella sp. AD-3 TaxID=686597 RepID=UPI000464F6DD|nr:preprotein translocase subunit SecG [Martelella sp. AD-3]AMM84950.1 preprotein translocase subunit SecG [Martelella sp. AD-3]MAM11210.1 preprotein translocase subunit SecG [Rhizobiaceae bacterium]|tara:strand:- start:1865 stop:2320 length:456 start_codon:yes stop_codon:yes gene_type:complete